jgi:hypothetical protein
MRKLLLILALVLAAAAASAQSEKPKTSASPASAPRRVIVLTDKDLGKPSAPAVQTIDAATSASLAAMNLTPEAARVRIKQINVELARKEGEANKLRRLALEQKSRADVMTMDAEIALTEPEIIVGEVTDRGTTTAAKYSTKDLGNALDGRSRELEKEAKANEQKSKQVRAEMEALRKERTMLEKALRGK